MFRRITGNEALAPLWFILAVFGLAGIIVWLTLRLSRPDTVDVHTLPDGTQCAVYRSAISCDWGNIPPTAELPDFAQAELHDGKLAWRVQ